MNIFVRPDGTLLTIGDAPKELELMGDAKRARASHIVPLHRGKRFAFMALRAIFGERGITAEWTRSWQCVWVAVIISTGESFVHPSRRCCLAWERKRLEDLLEQQ